jgi:hypothetical protein
LLGLTGPVLVIVGDPHPLRRAEADDRPTVMVRRDRENNWALRRHDASGKGSYCARM